MDCLGFSGKSSDDFLAPDETMLRV